MAKKTINLESVARGYMCRIADAEEHVIRTAEEWESLYKATHKEGKSPADYGLEYDFSKVTLLAVFLGESPDGSAVKIVEAKEKRRSIDVLVHQNIVESGENEWKPYHIVRLPKTDKKIVFRYKDNPDLLVSDFQIAP